MVKSGATRSFVFIRTISNKLKTNCERLCLPMKIAEKTWELAAPVAERLGLTIWDVKYVKEGASRYLRIFIDKEGGVFINDCEAMSREMNPILDAEDFIDDAYYFEVSSPGLGRELSRPEHFERCLGEDVRLRLYKADGGQKEYLGRLLGYGETIRLETEDGQREFPASAVARVTLADDLF